MPNARARPGFIAIGKLSATTFPCSISSASGGSGVPWIPLGLRAGSYVSFGGQKVCFTRGLSSNSDRNTLMPSTMEVRSFGSMRIQKMLACSGTVADVRVAKLFGDLQGFLP